MRLFWTLLILATGICLAAVSYLFLAAPLGLPSHEGFSNPRVPFAPVLFIAGVVLVLLSPVVYELIPEQAQR